MSVSDLLTLFQGCLSALLELPIFIWLVGAISFSGVVCLVGYMLKKSF